MWTRVPGFAELDTSRESERPLQDAPAGIRRSAQGEPGPYSDLSFEEKVDFYRHAGKWTNRMILGDSLLVMTSLAEGPS